MKTLNKFLSKLYFIALIKNIRLHEAILSREISEEIAGYDSDDYQDYIDTRGQLMYLSSLMKVNGWLVGENIAQAIGLKKDASDLEIIRATERMLEIPAKRKPDHLADGTGFTRKKSLYVLTEYELGIRKK